MAKEPEGADPFIRQDLGYPPNIDDWDFEVSDEPAPWSYRIGVFEGAEQYLGTAIYKSLTERFRNTPGIDGVLQDDREWYVVKSKLSAEEVRTNLWQAFLLAASDAFAGNDE